jgi:heme exporter protein A
VTGLAAEHLTARYPSMHAAASPALVDVNLNVSPGERLLLVGPNGAGKSTFLRIFAGLMRPTAGQALVGGEPAARARGRLGVVSHATYLYEELSALENLRLYGELYGVAQPRARAAEMLRRVGLPELKDKRVGELSRGQQQRVTLARALLHEPSVLLLDEPDTGLDVAAFGLLEELMTDRQDRTIVLTTHNLSSGLRLGTRAAVLAHGRIVHQQHDLSSQDGPALGELLRQLASA